MSYLIWADRGQFLEAAYAKAGSNSVLVGASRFGNVKVRAPCLSIWLQMRGTTDVRAKEGSFRLRAGDWIAFDGDSLPEMQTSHAGLVLGLVVPNDESACLGDSYLFAGKGRMDLRERNIALRLWRRSCKQIQQHVDRKELLRGLQALLWHLSAIQQRATSHLGPCPGRSRSRRRHVFSRLQRARLYLEGNADRIVRMSELAEISNYSIWYLSKAFHDLYGESAQTAAARLRIDRACDLLRTTMLGIGEIGEACGFDNSCSFARAFRARLGMTATSYRDRFRRMPAWGNTPSNMRKAPVPVSA